LIRVGGLGGAGIAVSALACGSSNSAGSKSSTAGAAQSTAGGTGSSGPAATAVAGGAASPGGAPKQGGVLRVPMRADPPHFEAYQINSYTVAALWGMVYNGMVRFQSGANTDPLASVVVPDVAQKYEQPDQTTYVFSLAKGVKFQNQAPVNGREATAADVKYSLQRLGTNDPNFRFTYMTSGIDAIETPDDYTVRIRTKQPTAPLINYLASIYGSILPHEVADQQGDFKKNAIGTGPFILKNYERNSKLELVRNPDYWEKGKPYLDGITVLIIADPSTQQASFTTKQIDLLDAISDPLQLKSVKNDVKDAAVEDWLSRSMFAFKFRFDRGPLADLRVRQALNMAYDRKGGVDAVFGGRAVAGGTLGPAFKDFALPLDQLGPSFSFDTKKAKELLNQAGSGNGFDTEAVVTSSGHGKPSADSGAYLRDQLKVIGVNVKVNDMEYAKFLDQLYVGDFDMQRAGWAAAHDVDEFLTTSYNYFKAGAHKDDFDPTLNALLDKERQTLDTAARKQVVADVQKRIADQAYAIATDAQLNATLWHPYVKNFRPHSLQVVGWGSRVLRETWLDRA